MNRDERYKHYDREQQILSKAWKELFNTEDEMVVAQCKVDVLHPPPAFGAMMSEVMTEIGSYIQEAVNEADEGAEIDACLEVASHYMVSVAVKMYQLGNLLSTKLPWSAMTPCGCVSPSDEELEQLLSSPFDLEGEGWLIKGFEHRKEAS